MRDLLEYRKAHISQRRFFAKIKNLYIKYQRQKLFSSGSNLSVVEHLIYNTEKKKNWIYYVGRRKSNQILNYIFCFDMKSSWSLFPMIQLRQLKLFRFWKYQYCISSNKHRASNKCRKFGYPHWNKPLPLISVVPLNAALIRIVTIFY